jgi:hypothetical protein
MKNLFVVRDKYKVQRKFDNSDLLHKQIVINVCKFNQEDTNLLWSKKYFTRK